ncbi:hypothetical protein M514_19159 [Trichuris suis]|uniref:Uncharacterized protein n=1 Tax=Trichuris suis TaxID=68888 RepID=A0A085NGX0_9BILA|nr:hypothetical protein M514_19159 [Trichuris suis]
MPLLRVDKFADNDLIDNRIMITVCHCHCMGVSLRSTTCQLLLVCQLRQTCTIEVQNGRACHVKRVGQMLFSNKGSNDVPIEN